MIHCSLNPFISLFDCKTGSYKSIYNLSQGEDEEDDDNYYYSSLRFFSCKFSGDESKIIASSGVKRNKKSYIKVNNFIYNNFYISIFTAHTNDINTICFIDKSKSNVFVSGSDDCLLKIWDTRALGSSGKQSGVLIGHVGGITSVDSRQDNYYIASNSKDQSLKLWDLRKSEQDYESKPRKNYNYDYRYGPLNQQEVLEISKLTQQQNYDNSIHTFRGHSVSRTLMRCHFSPQNMTEGRYLYTASSCGKLYMYDILNYKDFACVLNDNKQTIIRDAVWHPNKMEIITNSEEENLY
ncbi:WD repeat protein [Ichthyophthirius multifiliis]|uniref:WD repeat protein n=1 Tax=Ichthyophthirius multifiliis TaxID=5932 RepID=G0QXN2_ICHMU|nr:WD repeat protein [Ichthyophthirius multifiliis]EGR30032.1 WD repeat protein [Ichthyophthirius multifiliis]|eukprot:XP_004031268.1 WD repeat protein [Ichthyophthirius multifiliis]